jgi:hypothetical protein
MTTQKPQYHPARLESLRSASIACLRCELPKPMAGALEFRAHWVCAGCAIELQKLKVKDTK